MTKGIFQKILFLLIFSISLFSIGLAQNSGLSQQDLSKVQVDKLSDEQIQQFITKSEGSGMTMQQIEQIAVAKGMKPFELQKLKERISKVQSQKSKKTSVSEEIESRTRFAPTDSKEDDQTRKAGDIFTILTLEKKTAKDSLQERVFGYSIFNNKNLTFEPSLSIPTPSNYQIGSGDELVIDIWGASQANYKMQVSPEGNILVENVGPIMVNGLTIDAATKKIFSRLSSIYAGLGSSTFAQVSIGNLRSIKVSVIGEVNIPGTYTLPSLATAFNALYQAGGPNFNGTYRNIQIFRENKLVATLDVYDFLVKGDQKSNIRLQDQDVILVRPYKARVNLNGEVKTPAFFEMKEGENISNLIDFTGGFNDKAYSSRIKVYRTTEKEHKIEDIDNKDFKNFVLQNGDSINIEPILSRYENKVEIAGALYRPGQYQLDSGMTIKRLVQKAEGVRGDAFLSRAILYRLNDDLTIGSNSVDIGALLAGKTEDIKLQKDDLLKIFSIFDLQEDYSIKIEGEVIKPGQFPYIKGLNLEDLIAMAGGFKESATNARIEIARRVKNVEKQDAAARIASIFQFTVSKKLCLNDSASKFVIEPFDQVYIRRSPGYEVQTAASVIGEVTYPGNYSISVKNEKISDLIKRAGGLTTEAYPKGAKLIRKLPIDKKERERILKNLADNSGDSVKIKITDEPEEQAIGIKLELILDKPNSVYDLALQDGDKLLIPKELQTVKMSGAVLYPITARYDKSYGFRKYIRSAGGFSDEAKPGKSYVIYANGSVDRTSSFLGMRFYPKIEPGAEIIVPKKAASTKWTIQETAILLGVLSSVSTATSAIIYLIKQ